MRAALYLPRLEVRCRWPLHRHAERTAGQQLQGQGPGEGLPVRRARRARVGVPGPTRGPAAAAGPGGHAASRRRVQRHRLPAELLDTAHIGFLHFGSDQPDDYLPGTFKYYALKDRAPQYAVLDTPYGAMYGAYRPAGPGRYYWRIAQFLFPFWTMPPTGLLGGHMVGRAWVPMDDEHMMMFMVVPAVTAEQRARLGSQGPKLPELLPNTTGWLGRFRLVACEDNDYLMDRDAQERGEEYSGITGIHLQDQAITESMGPIFDRSQEHLGSSDAMVIRVRRLLLKAARALAADGTAPPGVDLPEADRQRSGGVILDAGADWVSATRSLREAYVSHPELDPAVVGGFV